MTHPSPSPAPAGRRYRFSIPRILICSILMALLVAACLYLYHTAFDFYHARMLENQSKTFAWLVEQVSFSLPFIIICVFLYAVYHKHDRRDGVAAREMFWEVLLLSALVYGVLYPYMVSISDALYTNGVAAGKVFSRNEGMVEVTLIMNLHEWFIRLSLPILVLLIYYSSRARRERLFPQTETAEPVITKAEYHARKTAEQAAEQAASTPDEDTQFPSEETAPIPEGGEHHE